MAAFGKANSNAKRCTGGAEGAEERRKGQTSPHNEHQGRFHPEQGIGLSLKVIGGGNGWGATDKAGAGVLMNGRGTTPTFKNVRQFANATSRVEQSLK